MRAYDKGQDQLVKLLKQTIRAIHLECEFPVVYGERRETTYKEPYRGSSNYVHSARGGRGGRTNTSDTTDGEPKYQLGRTYNGSGTSNGYSNGYNHGYTNRGRGGRAAETVTQQRDETY